MILNLPSSKHCIMFPAYGIQSAGGCDTTPRQSDLHFGGTDRLLQHKEWSRPPAAHLTRTPVKNKLICFKSKFINNENSVTHLALTSST